MQGFNSRRVCCQGMGDSVRGERDGLNLAHCVDPMVAQLCCSPILKQPVRTVEVLSSEYCPPPTIGLMRYTAGRIAAFFAHGQAISHHSGKVDHGREIIDRHTVRAPWRRYVVDNRIRMGIGDFVRGL